MNNDVVKFYIRKSLSFIKGGQGNNEKTNKNIIILLFSIAFLKVFLKKYINLIYKDSNKVEEKFKNIFTKDIESKVGESISYYILKLFLDFKGNYLDFFKSSGNFGINFSEKITDNINQNMEKKKLFGFDYPILPMKINEAKKYNEIIKKIENNINSPENFKNDKGIIEDINNNSIDILYCIISNLFLSRLYDSNFFNFTEYNALHSWLQDKLKKN